MKWFYPAALAVVAVFVLSPLYFLRGETDSGITGVVTGWDSAGKPLRNDHPIILFDSISSDIRSLDPITCGDTISSGIQANVFEGLYTYHYLLRPVGEKTIIPLLADALPTISDDRLTYTIPLKKGVLYQRNPCFGREATGRYKTRAVTAADFVLSFKRCADYYVDTTLSWAFLQGRIVGLDEYRALTQEKFAKDKFARYDVPVEGVTALDDHTLQIKLKKPYPQFLLVLAMHVFAPIPREAVDYWLVGRTPLSTEFTKPESLVGTGPYIMDTFEVKKRLIFVRNPDFRDDFYPSEGEPASDGYEGDKALGLLDDAGKKVPFIDVIQYDWMTQSYPMWMTFLSKRRDASGIPKETFEAVVTPGADLTDQWREKHIYLRKSWAPAVYWIAFNMRDPIVGGSKSLRQALCLAYDVESEIKVLMNGRGKRAVNVLPSTFPGHAEAGPGPYYQVHTKENKVKLLAMARAKLEDAKKELKALGRLDPSGNIPKLKLDMSSGDNASRTGDFYRQQFKKIGLEVEMVYNDWPTLQTKVHNKTTQMYTMGWHADYPDGENFLQLFYGPNINEGTNNTNYDDPEFNAWYEKARAMADTPERMELYVKMIRKLNEDVPLMLTSEPLSFGLFYDWVSNVKSHPIASGFTKYRRIDNELRKKLGGRTE